MKVKRTKLGPGQWRVTVIDKNKLLVDWQVRNSGLRLGPNRTAWLYRDEQGVEAVAFSLREIEQAAVGRVVMAKAKVSLPEVPA